MTPGTTCSLGINYTGDTKTVNATLTSSKTLGEGTIVTLSYRLGTSGNWTTYGNITYDSMKTNADGGATYTYSLKGVSLTGGTNGYQLKAVAVQNGTTLATSDILTIDT